MLFHMLRRKWATWRSNPPCAISTFNLQRRPPRIEDFENIAERRAQAAAKPPKIRPTCAAFSPSG